MNQCLPCFHGYHHTCVRVTKLIGMDPNCDCDHPDHTPAPDDDTDDPDTDR